MWNINTLWFDIALLNLFFMLGHIFFGHFEERSPHWRKIAKYMLSLAIFLALLIYGNRAVAYSFFGVLLLPVIYIHGILLPKKGINGWTGEPKSKYYEMRGWSKDVFKENTQNKQS